MTCDHSFVYQGVKYWHDPRPMPGTGALARLYFDAYYCKHCLEFRLEPLDAGRHHSYLQPMEGSSPVSDKQAAALRGKKA